MTKSFCRTAIMALAAMVLGTQTAFACGWYAIAACSTDYDAMEDATEHYGGRVINTDDFENFAGGYYCVVTGPKTKDAADITAERMRERGAEDAYIKESC